MIDYILSPYFILATVSKQSHLWSQSIGSYLRIVVSLVTDAVAYPTRLTRPRAF